MSIFVKLNLTNSLEVEQGSFTIVLAIESIRAEGVFQETKKSGLSDKYISLNTRCLAFSISDYRVVSYYQNCTSYTASPWLKIITKIYKTGGYISYYGALNSLKVVYLLTKFNKWK